MRVLATGDHHYDLHTRFAECIKVHHWMVDLARSEDIDLFLSGGDLYDAPSCAMEREATSEWLTLMSEVCGSVLARGNHDEKRDMALLSKLRVKHPIVVEEGAGVHRVAGASVAAVAWPNRAEIMASLGRPMPDEAVEEAFLGALRDVLTGLGNEMDVHDGPRILLGHFLVGGSVASTGQPLLGMPMTVGLADLALARAPLCIASHIHKRQEFQHEGVEIILPGSSYRTDFGELEEKSVMVAEFDGARLVSIQHIPTPCARMVHLEATWGPEGFDYSKGDFETAMKAGTEVRLRYNVCPDQREAADRAADAFADELRARGAIVAPPEEAVIAQTRARVPELTTATTLAEKLPMVWRSKGQEIGPERAARLLLKLGRLEQERHDAQA